VRPAFVLLALLLVVPDAVGEEAPRPVLRLLPIAEGLRDVLNPGGDESDLKGMEPYRRARKLGVDLLDLEGEPVVIHGMRNGSLFYLFYKQLERAYGPRVWVVQRIKRTERNWTRLDAEPETKVTFQVEAFKLFGGQQKRGDQHHGGYGIRAYARREIVKEYEIGFADIRGHAEGKAWPWPKTRLFEYVYPYGPEREIHDAVEFTRSLRWSLRVELDAKGRYRVHAPELGIDVPAREVAAEATVPAPIDASADLVLVRGRGLADAPASDWFADYARRAGPVLAVQRMDSGFSNTILAAGLMVNRREDGSLNTVQTRPGFAGRTQAGIGIGARRWEVLRAYGQPKEASVNAPWWHYGDVGFWFDGLGHVGRIYVRCTAAEGR
jgi:hypothetical protein